MAEQSGQSQAGGPAQPAAGGSAPPGSEELKGRRIGRVLTKLGRVTRAQVHEALKLQAQRHQPLGQLLVELGYIEQNDVDVALAAQAGMETVDLETREIPENAIEMLPPETAEAYQVLPVEYDEQTNTLSIALKSADNFAAVDDLQLLMGFKVRPLVAGEEQIDKFMNRYYGEGSQEALSDLIASMEEEEGSSNLEQIKGSSDSVDLDELLQISEDNKVKRLTNLLLMQTIQDKASDLHIEPFENEMKVRYRIDGILYEMVPPPKYLAVPIVSRLKVLAGMDIAERRVPQDGRVELTVGGNPVDLRAATLPTMFGEAMVMRVLDRAGISLDLEKIGMRDDDLTTFRQLIHKPNGIVVVTGPTGSGKTTTLYSALRELNQVTEKILTAEDPVEFDIDGLVQVSVNSEVGLTFAAALRSFLRQDPDIILVGETRDYETAQIGVEASLTGHLVLTTLHTNDAPSTVARLLDLGVQSFLLTATLEGIVAQRLVRKVCSSCREPFDPTDEHLLQLEMSREELGGRKFYYGEGCDYCRGTGHRGRMGLYEILVMNDELRDLVMRDVSSQELMEKAREHGMRTLRESGQLALFDGSTSVDEVVKETMLD